MHNTCDGLVLSERPYKENDKLITVLTATDGKMMFIAKGARSLKSKVRSLCNAYTYANFEYSERSGVRWLTGGSSVRTFFDMASELSKIALAAYVVELAGDITGESVSSADVLSTTLNTLHLIEQGQKSLTMIKSVYEIFALRASGFAPSVDACFVCGKDSSESGWWLDVMNGRAICAECQGQKGGAVGALPYDELMTKNILMPLDVTAMAAWRFVLGAQTKRVFSFAVTNEESLDFLARASEAYIVNHLERNFDTLEFYHNVKE